MKINYDEVSPITGNKCVIVEADEQTNTESYLCTESGYTTTDKLVIDSVHVKQYEQMITQLMVDAKFEDVVAGLVWYPCFMQLPGAMLYCKGDNPEELKWEVSKIVAIEGDERLKYPVPGKEGEYHTSRLDVENGKIYDKADFKSALDDIYDIVKKELQDENKLRNNSM